MEKPLDRRVQKTRALLYETLLDLMVEKGYEAITVQDLIDRANIGRSTFYSHFEDKEKLLTACIEQLFTFLQSQTSAPSEASDDPVRFRFSLAMFQHVQGHKLVYKAVVGKQSGLLVMYHMERMLRRVISEELNGLIERGALKKLPDGVLAAHILGSFWTLLHWWMEQKTPYSAFEMDRMFHATVLDGIRS